MEIFIEPNKKEWVPCPVCCGDPNKNDRLRGVCQNCEGVGTVDKPPQF
jgi:DnaJ-class molecular chaperone